jgi:uncharacterized BrkB/YihY/UPF0761 family membrane protein
VYVSVADNFDDTYGPLTTVMARLLWANLTASLCSPGSRWRLSSKPSGRAGSTRCCESSS